MMKIKLLASLGIFFYSNIILTAQGCTKYVDSLITVAIADTSGDKAISTLLIALSHVGDCLSCEALCHSQLGILYCEDGRYEAGYKHMLSAIHLRRKLGDSLRVAGNYSNIAGFKQEEGKYAQAINYGLTALRILEEQQRQKNSIGITDTLAALNLATVYNTLSNIQNDFGNHSEGLRYALKNLTICQAIGSEHDLHDAYYTLANRYFSKYQDTALEVYADSISFLYKLYLKYVNEHPDKSSPIDIANTHHNLASLAINQHNFNTAWRKIAISEAIYREEEDHKGIVDIEILKANTYIGQRQDYRQALASMHKALDLITQTYIDTSVQLEVFNLFSECFEVLGHADSALLYSRLAEHLYFQMFTSQQKRFNEIDRVYLEKRNELERNISQLEIARSRGHQRLWASLAAIIGLLATIGALVWRQRELRQKQRLAQQNQSIEDTLKDAQVRFLQGIIEGQQIERNETKYVLHNDIANTVLSLSYDIENSQPQHPQQKNWTTELRKLATHTRRLSHQKGGIIHDIGLFEGINDLVHRIRLSNQIEVEFTSNLNQKRLDATTEIELWHIVQELVSNTLKYAHATQIELSIESDSTTTFLTYNDNGDGFDYDYVLLNKKSMGLQSIIEKTQELNGPTPEIITSPGNGLTVSLEIPINKPSFT
jgi:two-component sensor histidine kinase/tetratricopeptide (TPR) repeat protein